MADVPYQSESSVLLSSFEWCKEYICLCMEYVHHCEHNTEAMTSSSASSQFRVGVVSCCVDVKEDIHIDIVITYTCERQKIHRRWHWSGDKGVCIAPVHHVYDKLKLFLTLDYIGIQYSIFPV